MATYSTDIHTHDANAPTVSGRVAICNVCNTQWQIQANTPPFDDAKGCSFCDAPKAAITVRSETE